MLLVDGVLFWNIFLLVIKLISKLHRYVSHLFARLTTRIRKLWAKTLQHFIYRKISNKSLFTLAMSVDVPVKSQHVSSSILNQKSQSHQIQLIRQQKIKKQESQMASCRAVFFLVLSYLQCFLVYLLQYLKDTIDIVPQTTTRYEVLCENRVTQI